MTFIPNWEEFEKSAEMLYLRDPMNTRYSVKYSHSKGIFLVKITDNKKASMITDVILNQVIAYWSIIKFGINITFLQTLSHVFLKG